MPSVVLTQLDAVTTAKEALKLLKAALVGVCALVTAA